ncbi:MAG: PAS domain-containing protein [Gemmatimonadaceae bacterium]|nr:PAS domain-containing protein [Gemmatimonadaceae bacterium]
MSLPEPATSALLPATSPPATRVPPADHHAVLEALLAQAPLGFALIDRELRFWRVNDTLAAINGRPAEAHIGRTVAEVLPWVESEARAIADEILRTKRPVPSREFRGETPAQPGVERVWRQHWFPVFSASGDVDAIGVLVEEITAQRAAEQQREELISALKHSEERLRLSMEAAYLIGFSWDIVRDEVHRLHSISEGLPPTAPEAPMRIADVRARVHPDDRELFDHRVKRALADPSSSYESEFRIVEPDGRIRWLYERGTVTRSASGEPLALSGLSQDITARKSAEEALQQANRRKDEFLATLAHELRNPLAPIRSAAEVLRLLERDDPRLLRAAAIIDRQVTQMVRLVDDLLDVNRITRGDIALHREVIDIARVVHAAVETSRPLLEASRHDLQLSLPYTTLQTNADAARLAQALSNVLNNAARYTPPGGRIALTVARDEGRIMITVTDNGSGIPSDRLEDIFDMFTRVAPADAVGGLGIGLALVRRIVQMHEGEVRAHSQGEGMGTTIEMWLPLHVPAAVEPIGRIHAGMRVQTDETTLRILIVDDNVDSATSQATMLELKHHVVCVVHDALAALDVVHVFEPDVALLDIGLPGMNGYELAQRLRQDAALAGMVLVAQTGWGQPADRARALEAGFDAHLTKPVDWASLQRVLTGSRVGGGRVRRR